jgi:type III pantothenate kinase
MANDVLLLDIGNTCCKWALQQDGVFVPGGEFAHAGQIDSEQLTQINLDHSPAKIAAVCVAGDKLVESLQAQIQHRFGKQVELISTPYKGQGISVAYVQPTQLGSDRWAAMVAAHQRWPGYLCVVDAGSALTLDIIHPDGQHQGGYILPGLRMMQNCLLEKTAIPTSSQAVKFASSTEPGSNTASCIANGILQAACGIIERTVMQLRQDAKGTVQCVLTGGDSQCLAAELNVPHVVEANLVLLGLAQIVSDRTKMA